jgi:[calcium/calmodulin-dependent protein kinase] kinase
MINQYQVIKTLGKGSYAIVKLCKDSQSGILYAVKQMNKRELKRRKQGKGKNAYDCVLEELKVMQKLEHNNIIFLHEIIDDPDSNDLYLVTEFQSKGSLANLIDEKNKPYEEHNAKCRKEQRWDEMKTVGLSQDTLRLYFHDLLKALHYCHRVVKVIHRDIKPDNIMINHNDEAVLIDFGVSALVEGQKDDEIQNNMGSYMFFSPEMFLKSQGVKVRGQPADIWALGITLYYLFVGRLPFEQAKNIFHLKELVVDHPLDFSPVKDERGKDLIMKMLEKDPEVRFTIDDIIRHDWVTDGGKIILDLERVEVFRHGKEGFGNLNRVLRAKTLRRGTVAFPKLMAQELGE